MGKVLEINGPLVVVHLPNATNGEQVRVGEAGLTGEVIGREEDRALVQVYEATDGMRPGEPVEGLGQPLSVELGPGLLGQIFDGVHRPLSRMAVESDFVRRGLQVPALDRDRTWPFTPVETLQQGGRIDPGMRLGTVRETETIEHRILVPPTLSGTLIDLAPAGKYRVDQTIARVQDEAGVTHELSLFHRWPVRKPRPYRQRDHAVVPLITGQRILDTFFPLLKGGKAAVPGPFGAGKTMILQQVARWANADIVIYVGCGERGNELVEILDSFPEIIDPRTGRSLMERTFLVANTSNMPVVAREASIYVGVTLAEYFRDQGYDVVMVADSTSRWAEALREVAGRMGQMPVEEGYPAYLASRLAAFYERAGLVQTLGGERGSVSLIGSVSPPGGDFSEPVTRHTKEVVQVYWALSKELADARHYPSVSWTESFSATIPVAAKWWAEQIDSQWKARRTEAMDLLTKSENLERIVSLVGPEALSDEQRWTLESAGLIKEAVLQQSALEERDSFASPEKQYALLDLTIGVHHQGKQLLEQGVPVKELLQRGVLTRVRRAKSTYASSQVDQLHRLREDMEKDFDRLRKEYRESESS